MEEVKKKYTIIKKKIDCPVKFAVKKIMRISKYNLLNDTKNNREKMSKEVKCDILKSSKSGRLIDDLGTLQYLVIMRKDISFIIREKQ